MKANQNCLSILTQSEIHDYFGIPRLAQEDREYYFELVDNEVKLISENWLLNDDMLRIAGSLKLGTIQASELIRSLLKSDRPYKN